MRKASCGEAAAGVRPPRKRTRPVETGRVVMKIDGRTIGCVSVRRSASRGSGEKTESHGAERTIVVWHGRPNVCVCDFRPAWLSPFSQGDQFFVSPPFQTNSKGICYSVSGKKLKNFVGTGRRNRGVRNKAGRAGFPTLPESSISFHAANRQRFSGGRDLRDPCVRDLPESDGRSGTGRNPNPSTRRRKPARRL
jgi:hypothetical protein